MRKQILRALFPVLIFSTRCLSSAQQPIDANGLLTLSDYLRYACVNNAALKAEFEKWTAATEQRSMFEVMQMFPWFGTIEARAESANASARSAGKQYEARKLVIFYELKTAFHEYSFLAQALEITKENLELARHFEAVARNKYATSTATHPDVIRAQIELANLENDVISLQKQRPAITAKLNSILNRPVESNLPWPKKSQYQQVSIDSQTLLALVNENNPELKAMDYDIEAAKSNKKAAEKRFYPELGFGVAVDAGMGRDMDSRTMPKIQLSLPIWRDNYKAGERQAKAQLRQRAQEKIQKANTLAADAQEVLYEYEDGKRKNALYGDIIIPKAKEMLSASETAYQTGAIDFLSLTDAQMKLLEYRLMYERALADSAQKLAELEMLCGTELSAPQKSDYSENK
jgi:cobalt-zinc-cadmium efflux system outer membrane protein